jgi:hypothetical protein
MQVSAVVLPLILTLSPMTPQSKTKRLGPFEIGPSQTKSFMALTAYLERHQVRVYYVVSNFGRASFSVPVNQVPASNRLIKEFERRRKVHFRDLSIEKPR